MKLMNFALLPLKHKSCRHLPKKDTQTDFYLSNESFHLDNQAITLFKNTEWYIDPSS